MRGKQGVEPLRKFTKILTGAMAAALLSTTAAVAADKVKVGVITTLVKGPVILGKEITRLHGLHSGDAASHHHYRSEHLSVHKAPR